MVMKDALITYRTYSGKTSRLTFKGTQMEPLDFDGVDGALDPDMHELVSGNPCLN